MAMPVTLRKRIQCHYCGKRLNPSDRRGSRVQCQNCTADNYFDHNGEITDVPVEDVRQSRGGKNKPDEIISQSDVFCSTCLKNQMIYAMKLSEYLPDPDDLRYEEFEAALPAYKKRLEVDYPQCCARCEPRVRQRLEQANYAAKSDHLRRMLQRNRAAGQRNLDWRYIFIAAAGLGQVLSTLLQVTWHISSSQVKDVDEHIYPTFQLCCSQYPVPGPCADVLSNWMPLSLLTGLLCLWWNPMWHHRLKRVDGRVVGLGSYYQLQTFVLTLRFVAWILAKDVAYFEIWRSQIHVVASVTISICFLWLQFGVLSLDTTPLVNWHQQSAPLVHTNQFSSPIQIQEEILPPLASQDNNSFSISNLSGPTTATPQPWRPPTPPLDEDSMDWTPSQSTFQPQPKQVRYKSSEPSPFYGNLPAKPSRGQLTKAPQPPAPPQAIGIPPGFFGLSKKTNGEDSRFKGNPSNELALAPPKFFPGEREFVTGLEGIFDRVFSTVTEEVNQDSAHEQSKIAKKSHDIFGLPPETSHGPVSRTDQTRRDERSSLSIRQILSGLAAVIFCIICISLIVVDHAYPGVTEAPSDILPYLSLVPALHLLDDCLISGNVSLMSSMWLAILTLVTSSSTMVLPASGSLVVPTWNGLVVTLVGLLMIQELYYFCRSQGSPERHLDNNLSSSLRPDSSTSSNATRQLRSTSSGGEQMTQSQSYVPEQTTSQPYSFGRRDSDESINSTYSMSSINTTSTASEWRTPKVDHRTFDWQLPANQQQQKPSTASAFSGQMTQNRTTRNNPVGGLTFGRGVGTGNNITGPRNYGSTPRSTRNRGY